MKQYFLLAFTVGSLYGQTTGTTLPAACIAGQIFTKTNATAGSNLYVALATANPCTTWTVQGGSGSAAAGPANAVQSTNGSGALVDSGCTATAGQITCPSGFVSTSSSPTLITLNEGTAPASPAATKGYLYLDSATLTKGLSFKDAGGIVTRTVKPDAGAPNNFLTGIGPDGVPTKARPSCADLSDAGSGCSGTAGPGGGATAGTVYTQSFTSQTSVALAHNMALSPTTSFTGQCFDSTGNLIVPANLVATDLNTVTASFGSAQTGSCTINAGGGAHFYAATMTSATTWTVAGTTHKLATCDLDVMAWDAATGVRHKVTPADISCDDTAGAFTVVVTFGAAQAGRLVLVAAK